MLTDAELSLAVGCDTKWLYNASQRLRRPLNRTIDDAVWWRLIHHLADGVGVPLAAAAVGADTLLSLGPDAGRVKLRATRDDAVSISVDLSRFYDGAALAAAAALQLATPRPRGRPRKRKIVRLALPTPNPVSSVEERTARLLAALEAVQHGVSATYSAVQLVETLADAKVAMVVVGDIAAAYHSLTGPPSGVDLVVDIGGPRAAGMAVVLNRLEASPRSVPVREGFQFDAALIRATDYLALRVAGIALNVGRSFGAAGEYPQLFDSADAVTIGARTYAVISAPDLLKSRH